MSSLWHRLYHGETNFDFVGNRRRWFTISGVLLLIVLGSMLVRGFNLSIDFTGGVAIEVPNETGADVAEFRRAVVDFGVQDVRIEVLDDGREVRIRTEALDPELADRVVRRVAEVAGVTIEETSVESIGPTFGRQITDAAIRALVIFLVVVALFISWRFEWKMAAAGLAALFHDLALTFGVYSLLGIEVTPATVIAVLTILGYSLYDTVVVFDKVRENVDELGRELPYTDIVNVSMNQVLMRSINTSLTSLLPVGSILVVGSFLFGAHTLREFALALFVGIAAGTYSSIFIASPLLATWKEREDEWMRKRRKFASRAGSTDTPRSRSAAPASDEAAPTPRETPKAEGSPTAPAAPTSPAPRRDSGAQPRPPKRRRRR